MLIYAPLFSVVSQYFGAEKTAFVLVSIRFHQIRSLSFSQIGAKCRKLTCNTPPIMLDLVPLHPNLVTPNHSLEPILLTKPLRDIGPKLQPDTPLARAPPILRLRIRPQHLHHEAGLPRLPLPMPVQLPDIVETGLVVAEQPAVQRQVLLPDQRRERQRAEALGEELEGPLVVLGLALALEAVDAVHVVRLVVAAVQEEGARPQPLVRVEQQGDLGRPGAAVDKVAIEEVGARPAREAVEAEDLEQVEELAVRVAADSQGRVGRDFHLDHRRFVIDYVAYGFDNLEDVFSVELFAGFESGDHVVDEFLRHFFVQSRAVVFAVYFYRVDI